MRLDLSNINLSHNDMRKNLFLPEIMTDNLAEDIGIMIGDGCLSIFRNKRKTNYDISCIGNLYDEKYYYKNYIRNLKFRLFNINFSFTEIRRDSTCKLRAYSKGIIGFYNKAIGLPIGKKEKISIPRIIFSKKSFLISCIRGIDDTDFSLVFKRKDSEIPYYPVIKIISRSKNLIDDLKCGLTRLNFKPTTSCNIFVFDKRTKKYYIYNSLDLNGKNQLEKWMKIIGFNNLKNQIKYKFWKENDFGPSENQILGILNKGL